MPATSSDGGGNTRTLKGHAMAKKAVKKPAARKSVKKKVLTKKVMKKTKGSSDFCDGWYEVRSAPKVGAISIGCPKTGR